jgi:hypothetical protein
MALAILADVLPPESVITNRNNTSIMRILYKVYHRWNSIKHILKADDYILILPAHSRNSRRTTSIFHNYVDRTSVANVLVKNGRELVKAEKAGNSLIDELGLNRMSEN